MKKWKVGRWWVVVFRQDEKVHLRKNPVGKTTRRKKGKEKVDETV